MRILHISKYYEPFKGGIEKVIMELACGTVSAGHEVVVLCSNMNGNYQEDMIEGVKVVRLPRWGVAFSQPLTLSMMWKAKQWLNWADVIQVHTPNPLAELSFLIQDNKKPLIVTYHCDVVRQKKLHKIYQPVSERLLQRADRITVSTPHHLKYSPHLENFKDKAQVIPFGIRAKHAQQTLPMKHELKKIKDLYGDYILFIGRLVPYKGVDVLLKAMAEVDENLIIIGEGPRWEAWHELRDHLGLEKKVHFVGAVKDDTQFAAYLHGCHALVLPSVDESEAFGMVLLEAMSCGKPVITTNLKSGVPWVNDKDVTGLQVEPRDVSGLTEAIHLITQNHGLRNKMGENALERFHRLFEVQTMVQSYLELYDQSLDQKQKVAS